MGRWGKGAGASAPPGLYQRKLNIFNHAVSCLLCLPASGCMWVRCIVLASPSFTKIFNMKCIRVVWMKFYFSSGDTASQWLVSFCNVFYTDVAICGGIFDETLLLFSCITAVLLWLYNNTKLYIYYDFIYLSHFFFLPCYCHFKPTFI